jgi:hypothetical protein
MIPKRMLSENTPIVLSAAALGLLFVAGATPVPVAFVLPIGLVLLGVAAGIIVDRWPQRDAP